MMSDFRVCIYVGVELCGGGGIGANPSTELQVSNQKTKQNNYTHVTSWGTYESNSLDHENI